MNRKRLIKLIGVITTCFIICGVFIYGILTGSFAYYFTSGNFTGSSVINIPAFGPKVNSSTNVNQSIDLATTIINNKNLAPGAVGKFKIDIDFTDVGTNAYYNVSFDRTDIPNNIHFYVDSELTKELTNIDGVQYKTYNNKLAEHYIYWSWLYVDTPEGNANDNLYMNQEIILPFTAHISQRIEGHTIKVNEIEKPTGRVNLNGTSGSFDFNIDFSNISTAKNYKIYFNKENNENNLHLYSDSEYQNEITSIDVNYDGTNNEVNKTIYWRLDGEEINNLSIYYVVY